MNRVTITKIDSNAFGVARLNDRPVLVGKVLPGEIVDIYKMDNCNKYDIVTEYQISHARIDRVDAPCPYYDRCGGCALQHAVYAFQRDFKIDKVKSALKHIAGIEIDVDEFVESPKKYGYRNKVAFVVKDYQCGMYSYNSKDFVKIDKCMLISDKLNKVFSSISTWIKQEKIDINHVVLREIEDKYQIVLVAEKEPKVLMLIEMLDKLLIDKYQLVFNKNSAYKDIITKDIIVLHGNNILDNNQGIKYPVSADSFLQVNREISNMIYNKVQDEIKGETVINAYSGAGLLSAILATKAKHVYGIEIVKNAHLNAESLVKDNNIDNLTNICGKTEDVLPKLLKNHKACTLVLDPPRKGVGNKLIELINTNSLINKIVYISCSPNSLAKNLRGLTNYAIDTITLYDMFPMTSHVESLVVLNRKV